MNGKRLGVRAAFVDGALINGDVVVADGKIEAVGVSPTGSDGIAVPGFIDLQVNGFGGVDFMRAGAADYRTAATALAQTGVTAYQPTIVSGPVDTLIAALHEIAKAKIEAKPRILGVHMEGPFLAPPWKGAHDERFIIAPDLATAQSFLDAGPVSMMTIAPEQPGGMDLLDMLIAHGVVVSVGHSDADAAQAHAAFDRGARCVTHLHNAQRRFAARDPGVSAVGQTRAGVTVGVIADFIHLAPETVLLAWRAARERFMLVTDAIALAPATEGEMSLGDRTVFLRDGAARLANGTLAGSVLTMDTAVRNLVSLGVWLPDAIAAATTTPARLMGREELGTLRPATPADVAILDEDLAVRATFVAGEQIYGA